MAGLELLLDPFLEGRLLVSLLAFVGTDSAANDGVDSGLPSCLIFSAWLPSGRFCCL